jgi:hypothetical protein
MRANNHLFNIRSRNVFCKLVKGKVNKVSGGTSTVVVLNRRAVLLSRAEDLDGGVSLDSVLTAQRSVDSGINCAKFDL